MASTRDKILGFFVICGLCGIALLIAWIVAPTEFIKFFNNLFGIKKAEEKCKTGFTLNSEGVCIANSTTPLTPEAKAKLAATAKLAAEAKAKATAFPKDITGLTGRYTVKSATAASWKDVSGMDNHAPVTKGTLKLDDINFVYGGPDDGIQFPVDVQGVDNQYTLFYVMRYDGDNKWRIFDGTDGNWLSGFHSGSSGVAHHGEWISDNAAGIGDIGGNPWVLGADTLGLYRANQMDLTTARAAAYTGTTSHITINAGAVPSQLSDWAAKEVIIYNRVLTLPEIKRVEVYLSEAHSIPKGQGIKPGMKDNGYFAHGVTVDRADNVDGQSIEKCRVKAVAASASGFGFRKSSHPTDGYKGSCFLYAAMGADTTRDWRHDIDHSVHCTNAAGIVEDECVVPV